MFAWPSCLLTMNQVWHWGQFLHWLWYLRSIIYRWVRVSAPVVRHRRELNAVNSTWLCTSPNLQYSGVAQAVELTCKWFLIVLPILCADNQPLKCPDRQEVWLSFDALRSSTLISLDTCSVRLRHCSHLLSNGKVSESTEQVRQKWSITGHLRPISDPLQYSLSHSLIISLHLLLTHLSAFDVLFLSCFYLYVWYLRVAVCARALSSSCAVLTSDHSDCPILWDCQVVVITTST